MIEDRRLAGAGEAGATACDAPTAWTVGVPATAVAVGAGLIILISPAAAAGQVRPGWLAWVAMAGVLASFAAAVFTLQRRPLAARHLPEVLLGIQAVITVTVTAGFPPYAWFTLYTLLAIGEGIVIRSLGALAVVTLTAGVDAWMVLLHGGSWSDAGWSTGLTTFLAGLCTYGYRRQFAVIAELKRTREELARTAVSAERVRFSRDLHDLLGHTLSVIVVKAEAVRRLVQRDRDAAAGHAADIEVIGRQALQEVREAVSGYRDAGLALELDRARSALAAAGIECMVSESGPALAPETDTLLSWVVREGVTNVVRHSGARHCHISLRRDGDPVRMEISDDGNGGDPAGALGSSGLRGLGERLAASGGRLEARGLSQGFSLAAEIPFASVENAS